MDHRNLNVDYRKELSKFYCLQPGVPTVIDFSKIKVPETFIDCSSKSFNTKDQPVLNVKLVESISFESKSDDMMIAKKSKANSNGDKRICTVKLFEIL